MVQTSEEQVIEQQVGQSASYQIANTLGVLLLSK